MVAGYLVNTWQLQVDTKSFFVSTHMLQLAAAFGTCFWTVGTSNALRLLCMNVEGFCFGVGLVATMAALVADIVSTETALATSMMFLCRSTGWVYGSTITAAILQLCLKKNLNKTIKGPEAAELIRFVRTSITKIRMLAPDIQVVVIVSLEKAIRSAFAYGVICAVLCFITALYLRDCQLGSHPSKR